MTIDAYDQIDKILMFVIVSSLNDYLDTVSKT